MRSMRSHQSQRKGQQQEQEQRDGEQRAPGQGAHRTIALTTVPDQEEQCNTEAGHDGEQREDKHELDNHGDKYSQI